MTDTLCYYRIQVEFDLQLHTQYNNLIPQAPILFLSGEVGTPTEATFDIFLEWCSANWHRVYMCAENTIPINLKGVCRKHANVCMVDPPTADTYFEGLCVMGRDESCASTGLTTVTMVPRNLVVHWPSLPIPLSIKQAGVYQVTVTPPDCAHTIERGWAKVAPRPVLHKGGYGNSCRTCGYRNHKAWDCPVSTRQDYKFAG